MIGLSIKQLKIAYIASKNYRIIDVHIKHHFDLACILFLDALAYHLKSKTAS